MAISITVPIFAYPPWSEGKVSFIWLTAKVLESNRLSKPCAWLVCDGRTLLPTFIARWCAATCMCTRVKDEANKCPSADACVWMFDDCGHEGDDGDGDVYAWCVSILCLTVSCSHRVCLLRRIASPNHWHNGGVVHVGTRYHFCTIWLVVEMVKRISAAQLM